MSDATAARGSSPTSRNSPKPEPDVLFQSYFKSVGPRTYAAQVKRAGNGNHFLVLTEGKRDEKTDEVRKTRLFVFSEDFPAFFRLVQEAAVFIRANPVPQNVKQKRDRFWAKQKQSAGNGAPSSSAERPLRNQRTASAPPARGPNPATKKVAVAAAT